MASVKRYKVIVSEETEESKGKLITVRKIETRDAVLASDYDRLVDVVRGFIACNYSCTCMRDNQCDFCLMRSRALAIIGEGGEESK